MTNQARVSYLVLAITLILVGYLKLGAPLLAILFAYFVLTQLARFIPNKWLTLAVFIFLVVADQLHRDAFHPRGHRGPAEDRG